jgi:hypothetical protein
MLKIMLKFIIIFLFINFIQSYMNINCINKKSYKILNTEQIQLIKTIIKNKNTTIKMREKINYILYNYYKPFAIKKSVEFKSYHKHKCINVDISELVNYSYEGLYRAILVYNGNSDFIKFISIFINGNLYKCMTESQSLNIIPKSYKRRKNYIKILQKKDKTRNYNKNNIKIHLVGSNKWILEKNILNKYSSNSNSNIDKIIEEDFYKNIWQKINGYDDSIKLIFNYKYDFYFNKINSNKKISKLLNCCEETVRLKINKVKNDLKNEILI